MDDLNILEKQIIIDALKFYNIEKLDRLSTGEIKVLNRLINILESENE